MRMNSKGKFKFAQRNLKCEPNVSRVLLFTSGLKATEKCACNLTLKWKQKSQRLRRALTSYETKVHIATTRVYSAVSENHPGLKTTSFRGIPVTRTDYKNQHFLSCVPRGKHNLPDSDFPVGRHFASLGHKTQDILVSAIRPGFRDATNRPSFKVRITFRHRTLYPDDLNVDFGFIYIKSARIEKRCDFCFYLSVALHAHFSVTFKLLMKREHPRKAWFKFELPFTFINNMHYVAPFALREDEALPRFCHEELPHPLELFKNSIITC